MMFSYLGDQAFLRCDQNTTIMSSSVASAVFPVDSIITGVDPGF